MMRLFRRGANAAVIDRLYTTIVGASRNPALYAVLAVPDTLDGRFESLALHAILVLRRLQACQAPGPEMAQHLVDTVFTHFDRMFREMGVGDTSVPKRMKTMAEAFLGRSAAYDAAFRMGHDTLAAALLRNVYSGRPDADGAVAGPADAQAPDPFASSAQRLATYAAASTAVLDGVPLQTFVEGAVPWLDPMAFATEIAGR